MGETLSAAARQLGRSMGSSGGREALRSLGFLGSGAPTLLPALYDTTVAELQLAHPGWRGPICVLDLENARIGRLDTAAPHDVNAVPYDVHPETDIGMLLDAIVNRGVDANTELFGIVHGQLAEVA